MEEKERECEGKRLAEKIVAEGKCGGRGVWRKEGVVCGSRSAGNG